MKKKFLFSLGLLMSWLTLSSFTDAPDNSANQVNGHEYVDLGLPSGTKWATCNVGANKPWEYGDFYAWGETEEKQDYSWETYKWCNGSHDTMTKYCTNSNYGTLDGNTVLEPEDDVANVKWGGAWHMPTNDEMNELYYACTWEWTEFNGVSGYKVTGPNGNYIFLPAAGSRSGINEVYGRDRLGRYWSSSLERRNDRAYDWEFDSDSPNDYDFEPRYKGQSVRPVCE